MKKIICLSYIILIAIAGYGQENAVQFLSETPSPPSNPCNMSGEAEKKFNEDILKVSNGLELAIQKKSDDEEQFMKDHEDQMKTNMIEDAGYSKEQAKQLQDADKMTDEQKMAMVNQMMMEKSNMNLDDFKKLAKMDTASQKRWAQGYATMAMAEASADPQKMEKDQKHYKDSYNLISQQKFQIDKIQAGQSKYLEQLDALNKQADSAFVLLREKLDKLDEDLANCENDACRDQIDQERRRIQEAYCARFTPDYIDIITQYKIYIEKSLPDYDLLDELNNKVTESQTRVKNTAFSPGLSALSLVKSYVYLVTDSFKFRLIPGENSGIVTPE